MKARTTTTSSSRTKKNIRHTRRRIRLKKFRIPDENLLHILDFTPNFDTFCFTAKQVDIDDAHNIIF